MYVNEDTLFNDDEFVTQNLKRIHIDIHHDITDIVCFIIMWINIIRIQQDRYV